MRVEVLIQYMHLFFYLPMSTTKPDALQFLSLAGNTCLTLTNKTHKIYETFFSTKENASAAS